MKHPLQLLTVLSTFLGLTLTSQAALIFYEGFDYPTTAGTDVPTGSGGVYTANDDDGNTGIFRDGLTMSNYVSGGLAVATDSQELDARDLAGAGLNSLEGYGTLYMSGFFQGNIGNAGWGAGMVTGFLLSDATGSENMLIGLTNSNIAAGDGSSHNELHPFAGFGNDLTTASGNSNIAASTANLSNATTYFIMAKFEVTNSTDNIATVSVMAIPDGQAIPTSEPTTWDAVTTSAGYGWAISSGGGLDLFEIGQGNTPGTAGVDNLSDEFRLATSYEGALPAVIPEPSTFALITCGLLTVLCFRRRRA